MSGRYQRYEDRSLVVVRSIFIHDLIEHEIEHLINLGHPYIAVPFGFAFATGSRMLKVMRLYSDYGSLAEVLAGSPMWWTPTAKAKAIAGIVLGLRFAHSLGRIHGHLKANNILFDSDHRIQITDLLCGQAISGFSGKEWDPQTDIRGFASLLFEIVVGCPASDETNVPDDVPIFVSEMIRAGILSRARRLSSFVQMFQTLKQHDFKIVAGVDSADVLAFVNWVELLEQSRE
jgi:serine/threonine protein kinase